MSRHSLLRGVVLAMVAMAVTGCRPQQPGYLFEDGDLSHYVGVATQIEFPDVDVCSLDDAKKDMPPFTLENSKPKEIWDLKLEEATRIALANSKVLKEMGAAVFAGGDPDNLLRGLPYGTVYDPALTETNPRFGVEAALSAFDAQLATTMNWEHGVSPQNSADFVEVFRPSRFIQDLATFQTQLSKTNAMGGTAFLRHNVGYELNNSGGRQFLSNYTTNVEMEVRQPLLQGFGAAYNRIAGPGAIPGFNNGVMIARVQTDISLADFEGHVRNSLGDVENAYWELYRYYRRLDSLVAGRDSALQTWRQVHEKMKVGATGGGAQQEAQTRAQYFFFLADAKRTLRELHKRESNLRYLLGLAATDGRLIRPADEPTMAKVNFDWYEVHAEAMVRYVELRRQKWVIKQRELELIAAKNWLLPRLDAVARYRWSGLGHILLDKDNSESNAYGSMTSGQYPDWLLGFEFRMPLGFRKESSGVRYAQMALARERAVLQEMELELSHQLADAFARVTDDYVLAQTNFNARIAEDRDVAAADAARLAGVITVDELLRAQQRKVEAEVRYYDSLVGYNIALKDVHFKKGSLLEYNGVCLAEGPWPEKAYFDARRRARARDASVYLNYGFTQPRVVSRGPIVQHAGTDPQGEGDSSATAPDSPEAIPAPMPEPAGRSSAPGEMPQSGTQRVRPNSPAGPVLGAAAVRRVRPTDRPETRYDLGAMNLNGLSGQSGAMSAAQPAPSPVQPVSYQEASSAKPNTDTGKGDRPLLPERPEGCFAQKGPVPFSLSTTNTATSNSTSSKSNSAATKPAGDGWKGAGRSDKSHEPVADLPSAQADQSASGWKRVQR